MRRVWLYRGDSDHGLGAGRRGGRKAYLQSTSRHPGRYLDSRDERNRRADERTGADRQYPHRDASEGAKRRAASADYAGQLWCGLFKGAEAVRAAAAGALHEVQQLRRGDAGYGAAAWRKIDSVRLAYREIYQGVRRHYEYSFCPCRLPCRADGGAGDACRCVGGYRKAAAYDEHDGGGSRHFKGDR